MEFYHKIALFAIWLLMMMPIATGTQLAQAAANEQRHQSTAANSVGDNGNVPRFVEDQLLLKFKEGTTKKQQDEILGRSSAQELETIPGIDVKIIKVAANAVDQIEKSLQANSAVKYVERDFIVPQASIPNDPYFSQQWHLNKIGSPKGWDIGNGGNGITIAILDTGIDLSHPDLAAKVINSYNAYDKGDVSDTCGHGTAVAGVAAAITNNGIGVAGVAPNSKIMPIKITDASCNGYYSAMSKGIVYAADQGARVANISFAIYGGSTLTDAAKYMYDKGGWVTAAAGNSGKYENYSDNPYIISVSGTDANDGAATWSSYGQYVDFAAPGTNIYTTITGGYGFKSGTSFSSPIVAGTVGLLFAQNPALSPSQVYANLKQSAVDLGVQGYDYNYGHGRIDAYSAILLSRGLTADVVAPVVTPPPDQVVEATSSNGSTVNYPQASASDNVGVVSGPTCTPSSGTVFSIGTTTVTCTAADAEGNVGSASFRITVGDTTGPAITVPSDLVQEAASASGVAVLYTAFATDVVDGPLAATCTPSSGSMFPIGTATVACTATDAHGNTGEGSFEVKVQDTTAPSISAPAGITAEATGTITQVALGNPQVSDAVDQAPTIGSDAPNQFPLGVTAVTWTATDFSGNSATAKQQVTIVDTTAPSVLITSPQDGSKAAGTITVTADAWDLVGISQAAIYFDDVLVSNAFAAPFEFSVDSKKFNDGNHKVQVVAIDISGNPGYSNVVTLNIKNIPSDATAPVVSISSPAAGSIIQNTVTISITASDSGSGMDRVELYIDGRLQSTMNTSPYTYSWNTRSSADGTHTIAATAFDKAGNNSSSQTIDVKVINKSRGK